MLYANNKPEWDNENVLVLKRVYKNMLKRIHYKKL